MLKRLELWGFKSFADKTVFEFGRGITAIVGPNGSGKSNIVDAIRWVLGEQSAKSLRGKEMADCIFNGSGTRKSLGFAEVTLTLDNSRRTLRIDSDEVSITRRVDRSGNSEYFINRSPARLRDIRELFLGTGTATQAYSIIEQGRVDVVLQASTKERRLIFEEASGISRFKVRKLEALKRLEHVDQNLMRVNDILEEVTQQLNKVRAQAAKAQQYRQLWERLKDCRLQLGLFEYASGKEQMRVLQSQLSALSQEASIVSDRTQAKAVEELQLEQQLQEVEGRIRTAEAELGDVRQEVARLESTLLHERQRARQLEAALQQARGRWLENRRHARELQDRLQATRAQWAQLSQQLSQQQALLDAERQRLGQLDAQLQNLDQSLQSRRAELTELLQQATALQNRRIFLETQTRSIQGQLERYQRRQTHLHEQLHALDQELQQLQTQQDDWRQRCEAHRRLLEEREAQRQATLAHREELAQALASAQARRQDAESRLHVYYQLRQTQEGLSQGIRALLNDESLRPHILGVVGELLEADLKVAPLLDRALGPLGQAVVVRRAADLGPWLQRTGQELPGPAAIVALDWLGPRTDSAPVEQLRQLGAEPAQELASASTELLPLRDALLHNTWLVPDDTAAMACRAVHPGGRYLTRSGRLYEANGAVLLGPVQEDGGLLSRNALIRSLEVQVAEAVEHCARLEAALKECQLQAERQGEEQRLLGEQLQKLREHLAELGAQLAQQRHQRQSVQEELDLLVQEATLLADEQQRLQSETAQLTAQQQAAAERQAYLQAELRQLEQRRHEDQSTREARWRSLREVEVELARDSERLRGLERELEGLELDLQERQHLQRQALDELRQVDAQLQASQRTALQALAQLSELYHQKEELSRRIGGHLRERDAWRASRQELSTELQSLRQRHESLQQSIHELDLQLHEVTHRQETLVERLREEFQIDLAALYSERGKPENLNYEDLNEEANRLKRKLQALGNVNLQALEELDELERRAKTLHEQRADLLSAKASLQQILDRINEDSRRIFLETFESIRTHFRELFRKLFGGGKADIILEDPNDVLESGVEIIAKPPGKELRSLSLLSGGEKTLTAVALLLAIFQAKPSSFCVLDEVDAALDEANIDRFTAVLREFLDQAQFILVTHSKKTMLAADVLYGVTMQESGVSKRISLRLEDVNDQGEISPEALRRAEEPVPPQAQEAAA